MIKKFINFRVPFREKRSLHIAQGSFLHSCFFDFGLSELCLFPVKIVHRLQFLRSDFKHSSLLFIFRKSDGASFFWRSSRHFSDFDSMRRAEFRDFLNARTSPAGNYGPGKPPRLNCYSNTDIGFIGIAVNCLAVKASTFCSSQALPRKEEITTKREDRKT